MTIVVTGATGQLGRLVVESLLSRGASPADVLATGRDADRLRALADLGVRTAVVDYADPASLRDAFDGADRVLFVSGSEVGQRIPQHTNVVEALRSADVGLVAYTSIAGADSSTMQLAAEHQATEQMLRDAALPLVLLRNSWYLENYTPQVPTYLEHGAVVGAAGDGRVSAATRADYADAAAAVLLDPDATPGTAYELGGEGFTLAELAAAVSEASGREVVYRDVTEDELAGILVGAGLPDPVARVFADSDRGIARGELEVTSGDLERLIGRAPTSMRQAVADAVAAQS
ncbi:SDR family oxidoreductase [Phycicoccus sp. MAQZ13P-2]|uniref:SDR family oxidoreductase n=1 Tax=Phycicoccus mangrovi TaxID=2840470 RepID=UPI001C008641|nr:SDR family oxidoreductase [Phycicoccus mangrovi]MBT9254863.1 SDR family oxidoreductase [Phycicoccus mangrovi]MBT9272932.1 SDR family oxidoreductase [Phycicoccus mangrovi]